MVFKLNLFPNYLIRFNLNIKIYWNSYFIISLLMKEHFQLQTDEPVALTQNTIDNNLKIAY